MYIYLCLLINDKTFNDFSGIWFLYGDSLARFTPDESYLFVTLTDIVVEVISQTHRVPTNTTNSWHIHYSVEFNPIRIII